MGGKYEFLFYTILFGLGVCLGMNHIKLLGQLQREFIALYFFAVGSYTHKYKLKFSTNKFVLIGLFLALIPLAKFVYVDLVGSVINSFVGFFLGAIGGIYFIISLSKYWGQSVAQFRDALSYCGSHTIPILALHFLSFKLISLFLILFNDLDLKELSQWPIISFANDSWWWIAYSIVGVGLPLMIQYVFKQCRNRAVLLCKQGGK